MQEIMLNIHWGSDNGLKLLIWHSVCLTITGYSPMGLARHISCLSVK